MTVTPFDRSPTPSTEGIKRCTFKRFVYGVAGREAAIAEAQSDAPGTVVVDGTTLTLRGIASMEALGGGTWRASLSYTGASVSDRPATGSVVDSFSTRGGARTVRQSIATQCEAPPSGTCPDFGGAIGVSEGGVAGASIPAGTLIRRKRIYIAAASVSEAWIQTLAGMTPSVNDDAFLGYAAGELLLVGVTGTYRPDFDDYEADFEFLAAPNVTGETVPGIPPFDHKGHELVEVYYEPVEDAAAKRIVQRPAAVFVHQVFPEADFAGLGL